MANQAKPEKQNRETIENPFDFSEATELRDWMALLTDPDNPPLGFKAKHLAQLYIDDPLLDFDIAEKALSEPAFVKQTLHIMNDAYLSSVDTVLRNIPRAIILLGFQSVRNVVLLIAIVDKLLHYSDDPILHKEVAQMIAMAILAMLMAQKRVNILNSEKIFTAMIMHRIGRVLYYVFSGEKSADFGALLQSREYNQLNEEAIVGFSLTSLSEALTMKWHLLEHLIVKKGQFDIYELLLMSESMVESLSEGWASECANQSAQKIKSYLNISLKETNRLCMDAMQRTLEVLAPFQIESLLDKVPLPHKQEEEPDTHEEKVTEKSLNATEIDRAKDVIASFGKKKSADLNDLLDKALKLICQTVHFDRVVLALLSPDREFLRAKVVCEKEESGIIDNFEFEILTPEGWLFQHILREQRPSWVGGKSEWVLGRLRTTEINKKIGKGPFFAAPLIINGRSIGLYYADRRTSKARLDIKSYDAFLELCHVCNEMLKQLQS